MFSHCCFFTIYCSAIVVSLQYIVQPLLFLYNILFNHCCFLYNILFSHCCFFAIYCSAIVVSLQYIVQPLLFRCFVTIYCSAIVVSLQYIVQPLFSHRCSFTIYCSTIVVCLQYIVQPLLFLYNILFSHCCFFTIYCSTIVVSLQYIVQPYILFSQCCFFTIYCSAIVVSLQYIVQPSLFLYNILFSHCCFFTIYCPAIVVWTDNTENGPSHISKTKTFRHNNIAGNYWGGGGGGCHVPPTPFPADLIDDDFHGQSFKNEKFQISLKPTACLPWVYMQGNAVYALGLQAREYGICAITETETVQRIIVHNYQLVAAGRLIFWS